jgi:hypothetical protein
MWRSWRASWKSPRSGESSLFTSKRCSFTQFGSTEAFLIRNQRSAFRNVHTWRGSRKKPTAFTSKRREAFKYCSSGFYYSTGGLRPGWIQTYSEICLRSSAFGSTIWTFPAWDTVTRHDFKIIWNTLFLLQIPVHRPWGKPRSCRIDYSDAKSRQKKSRELPSSRDWLSCRRRRQCHRWKSYGHCSRP